MPNPPSTSQSLERDKVLLELRLAREECHQIATGGPEDWHMEDYQMSARVAHARIMRALAVLTPQPEPAPGAGIAELVDAIRRHEHECWPWIVKQDARLYAAAGMEFYVESWERGDWDRSPAEPAQQEPAWPDGSTAPLALTVCACCGDTYPSPRYCSDGDHQYVTVPVIPSPVHSGEQEK